MSNCYTQETVMQLIKSCPFCGSQKVEVCRTNPEACWIRCARCGADAPSTSKRKRAIAIWNKRPKAKVFSAKIVDDQDVESSV